MRAGRRAALLMAGLALAAVAEPIATPDGAPARPSLVVVIVVDQLPADRLDSMRDSLRGGYRRLLDSGRRFSRCAHDHASTETGPGHATLLSGLNPRRNGIILNDWYDALSGREVYCAGDDDPDALPSHDGTRAASARHLKDENLGDLIKRSRPGARVYSIAGKDRSAVLTAGHAPDGAFWLSFATGGYTTSPRIVRRLPSWGHDFWGADPTGTDLFRAGVPAAWTYPLRAGAMPDDYPYEADRFSRVAPHPLAEPREGGDEGRATVARRVGFSPWQDWLTLQLAARILDEERLGRDAVPDLLILGLSGADYVGHIWGPDSQEYLDLMLRVDGWLGDFMRRAEEAASATGGVLFALSADHGVLPIPETVAGARRIDAQDLRERLTAALHRRLPSPGEGSFIAAEHSGHVYFDRGALQRAGVTVQRAAEELRRAASGFWEISRIYAASDLISPAGGDPFLDLYRNAYDPERGGDVVLQPCEKCLVTSSPFGTSHGTPYDYDRRVPMILMGPGVEPGLDDADCRTVDLAPTIAEILGLEFRTSRDGTALPLVQVDTGTASK